MKLDKFKNKQVMYYQTKWRGDKRNPKEKTPVAKYFSNYALNKIIKLYPLNFSEKHILITCGGGDGYEIAKMKKLNGVLTVSDISPDAILEVKKQWPGINTIVADTEKLPFKDNFFQIGLVKDGFHHLIKPEKGIKELLRVCSEAIMIIDFQDTSLNKFLTNIGLSPEVEEAGNQNYRFSRNNLTKLFQKIKINNYKISSCFVHAPLFQRSWFQKEPGFLIMKILTESFNYLFGSYGNVIMIVVKKQNE